MRAVKPFGDLSRATILVIGHDLRLQDSDAEAEVTLFMDYLLRPKPAQPSKARKYELAQAVVHYVAALAGREVHLEELYVTNLCNEFLPHAPAGSTVYIRMRKRGAVRRRSRERSLPGTSELSSRCLSRSSTGYASWFSWMTGRSWWSPS